MDEAVAWTVTEPRVEPAAPAVALFDSDGAWRNEFWRNWEEEEVQMRLGETLSLDD